MSAIKTRVRKSGDWTDEASCRNFSEERDLWFDPQSAADEERAKRICRFCPVKQQCLDYSLANGEKHGIWGGLDEKQRRAVRLQRLQNAA